MQICFLIKRKKKMGKYTAKLIILWYDNFGENHTLCRGMAWLPFQKGRSMSKQLNLLYEAWPSFERQYYYLLNVVETTWHANC